MEREQLEDLGVHGRILLQWIFQKYEDVDYLSRQYTSRRPPISVRSIIVVFSHLRLGLQAALFPSGCLTKTL